MSPDEINRVFIWVLCFAYPLTLIVLWRKWLPGAAFAGFLAAASVWVWIYDANVLWRVLLASGLTTPLEVLATLEIAHRFLDDDWHDHKVRILRVIRTMGAVGAVTAWGLHSPNDAWTWYSLIRACVHIGCLSMLITTGAYAGMDRIKVHRLYWVHGALWLVYVTANVAGSLLHVRIPYTDEGTEMWFTVANCIHIVRILCLAVWMWTALTVPRADPLEVSARLRASV